MHTARGVDGAATGGVTGRQRGEEAGNAGMEIAAKPFKPRFGITASFVDPRDPADPVAIASDSAPGRILILGAPDSGTTTFLTRLYERYRPEPGGWDLRVVPSEEHDRQRLENHLKDLRAGRWPPSTRDSRVFRFEVFHGSREADVLAITNVSERFLSGAAGALELGGDGFGRVTGIVLIVTTRWAKDRCVADHRGEHSLVTVLQSIRRRQGAATVPVALVFAKADQQGGFYDEEHLGSRAAYWCGPLIEGFPKLQISTASAVREEQGPDGRSIPRLLEAASGLEEPLLFCLYGGTPVPRRYGSVETYPILRLLTPAAVKPPERASRRDEPAQDIRQPLPAGWRGVVSTLVGLVILVVVPLGLLVGIILGLSYLILDPF